MSEEFLKTVKEAILQEVPEIHSEEVEWGEISRYREEERDRYPVMVHAHRIEQMTPHPESVLAEGERLLGEYRGFQSPGAIVLYTSNLASFFWHTMLGIERNGHYLTHKMIEDAAFVTVLKTYHHERFHLFADVVRHLFGGSYERNREESLAVAYSHYYLVEERDGRKRGPGPLPSTVLEAILKRIFAYTAPGYREWVNFRLPSDLWGAVAEYLGRSKGVQLLNRSWIDSGEFFNHISVGAKEMSVRHIAEDRP